MSKKESILSQFYRRKDAPGGGGTIGVTGPGDEALRPQLSSTSTRSISRASTPKLAASPTPPQLGEPVGFKIRLETPPAIMYGSPQESVGALISGICDVDLTQCYSEGASDGVDLQDVSMSIIQVLRYKVPSSIAKKLAKGSEQQNVLATWDILKYPHILQHANFEYPFSHLLPGTLPPTCDTPLFSVHYFIKASATTQDNRHSTASLPLPIGRSVVNVADKTSVRIFPPTTLSLSMILPSAVFPLSKVPAEMRIEGMVTTAQTGTTAKYKRWILKRINWRVDEIVKVKYGPEAEDVFEQKESLGFGVHKTGWKTDYETKNGLIEFDCSDFCPGCLSRANKDMNDPVSGTSVSHLLIVELLIAEEIVSKPGVKQGILSGSARVLRMQFALAVVDRPGLGISWEDEVPPMYADIPLSPPQYKELPALEEFKTNGMVFSPLLGAMNSPTLRHIDPNMRNSFEHANSPLIQSTMATQPNSPMGFSLGPARSNPPPVASLSLNSPALHPSRTVPSKISTKSDARSDPEPPQPAKHR